MNDERERQGGTKRLKEENPFSGHRPVADFPIISGRPLIHAVSQGTSIPGMVFPPLAAVQKLPPLQTTAGSPGEGVR
ncbi:hypothetical protein ASZ90_014527 [hydrocarbon metagenome]|uniref:Uncharacterized protein n=1 Tax=hydrocarbon metagenome TaxID=938273 RepID=A0A0W8F4T0_9ZZZZ